MQREACREFAKSKGWHIVQEFSEKGVSGFKVSSKDREALQEIKKATLHKRFDVLLVFMFDRLGRRDDETPFVVEWFVKNGIEVWSVIEGEQRFEDHVDKLLNYIRYWQSSGESIKTSIRTKTRMEQLTREGVFTGGVAPYGYDLLKMGRVNKRGHDVHDITVNHSEAEVVRKVFTMYCEGKMGTHRIASYLNLQDIKTKQGNNWGTASIRNMLRNIAYTGVLRFGDAVSDNIPFLRIIDDNTFAQAQKQVEKNKLEPPRGLRSVHRASVLLSEVMYCMHCGKRMTVTCNKKTREKRNGDTVEYIRIKYICANRAHCTGQWNYSAKTVDRMILSVVSQVILPENVNNLKVTVPYQNSPAEQIARLKYEREKEKKSLDDLKREVVEVIKGQSAFGSVLIRDLIQRTEERIADIENEIALLGDLEAEQKRRRNKLFLLCSTMDFSDEGTLQRLLLPEQQEIIEQFIERLEIGTGYEYKINWTFGGEPTAGKLS